MASLEDIGPDADAPVREAPAYATSSQNLVADLETDLTTGLSAELYEERLSRHGANQLRAARKTSRLALLLQQFANPLMVILLIGAAISGYTSDIIDAVAICAIVLLNALIGFFQEYKAERSLAELGKMVAPTCVVRRDGLWQSEPAARLVPGDIIRLKAGDIVPADVRLAETARLQIDEAALTGESEPSDKSANAIVPPGASLADRSTMAYMSTQVTLGTAMGIVVATGMDTEVGKIADLMTETTEPETPLQKRISNLSRVLIGAALFVVAVVAGIGVLNGMDMMEMFNTAISLSVASIPEGLPTIVTIVLTIGSRTMVRKKALARRLACVETLGTTSVVCTDKTGTLTQNQMQVMRIWAGGKTWRITGRGFDPNGQFLNETDKEVVPADEPDLQHMLEISALCNEADLIEVEGKPTIQGNPTEGALVVAAAKAGITREALLTNSYKLLASFPFDSERKMMSMHMEHASGEELLLVKGAPDMIVSCATHVRLGDREVLLTDSLRREVGEVIRTFGHDALRTLAIAYRQASGSEIDPDEPEQDLVLLGIHGIMDPPRPEVSDAVREAQAAGVRTIMITGDHAVTAQAIAGLIGLRSSDEQTVYTGAELDTMSEADLQEIVGDATVFARVTPTHKLRIVGALQARGEVAAMTGDGVNDAPALRKADIGIAMGITGTSVAKDSAALVLLDDNFATIVTAIRQGRRIYDNIRKYLRQALTANVAEVSTILFAFVLMGSDPLLPLTPLMILWVNLVSDGLPALTLGFEPAEEDVMRRAPRHRSESIFSQNLHWVILFRGLAVGGVSYLMFSHGLGQELPLAYCQSLAFMTLVFAQLWHLFDARATHTLFDKNPLSNPYLVLAVLFSAALSLAAIYTPAGRFVLSTEALSLVDVVICFGIGSLPTLLLSGLKRVLGLRFL